MRLAFSLGIGHFQRLHPALGKPGLPVPAFLQFRLHPPHHHRAQLFAARRHRTGEALVIQQFQQRREALPITVMRGRRQKQLVFKVRGQSADRLGALRIRGVMTAPGRRDVMRLVHDQQVIGAGINGLAVRGQQFTEPPQRSLALEEINRGDQAGKMPPRVDMNPALPPQTAQGFAVDNAKFQAELVAHFLLPLDLQR